jgi:hypothetical protein
MDPDGCYLLQKGTQKIINVLITAISTYNTWVIIDLKKICKF